MNLESWEYWYPKKEGTVEPELLRLESILKEKNLSRVLDFGCRAGRHTLHVARNGFKVHGFDASASAVERATQLLHDEGLRADLKVHDMLEPLPYPGMFFDAGLATRVIHHTLVGNIKRIVSEVDRVLKNGGYVLLQVPEYEDHERVLREAQSTHRVPRARNACVLGGR